MISLIVNHLIVIPSKLLASLGYKYILPQIHLTQHRNHALLLPILHDFYGQRIHHFHVCILSIMDIEEDKI